MVDYPASKYKVGYASETAHATGGTPTTAIKGHVNNITINPNNNMVQIRGLGNRHIAKSLYGNFSVSGSIAYTLGYGFDIGAYLIGPVSGAGSVASPYICTENDYINYSSGIKTCVIEASQDTSTDDVDKVTGCLFTDVTFSGAIGQAVSVNANFIGSKHTISTTANTIGSYSGEVMIAQEGAFKWGTSPAAISRVQNFSITLGNTVSELRELGTRFNVGYLMGNINYTFTVTVSMNSDLASGMITQFLGGTSPTTGLGSITEYGLQLLFSQGSSSGDDQLQIQLANCTIQNISKPINLGGDMVMVTITGYGRTATDNIPIKWWAI